MNIDFTNGKKPHFDSIEDVMQTFISIASVLYDVAADDVVLSDDGVLNVTATTANGRIRIRIDYVNEDENHD